MSRWMLGWALAALAAAACNGGNDDDGGPSRPVCPAPRFDNPGDYTVETVVYDTPEGAELLADLYTPEGEGPFPGMVMIHGGGWFGGNKEVMRLASEHYAASGFAVMNIQYRLLQQGIQMDRIVRDNICAVRWFRAHASTYKLQKACLGVLGESAGGHLAGMVALANHDPAFQAGCEGAGDETAEVRFALPYYGALDFDTLAEYTGEIIFAPLFGDNLNRDDYSPAQRTDANPEVDFLMVHGDADPLVPLQQSELMMANLLRDGHRAELYVVQGAGHGFVGPPFLEADNQDAQPHVETFVTRVLAGE